ncbi:MAG: hypothetical protein P8Y70_01790 [Candidatus Lokiarchaeota archaeon]
MNIHSIFILRNTGGLVYSKNFTEEIDFNLNLITGFFSAIFSFSEKVIDRNLEVLEMGNLRFVFRVKNEFIFVILSEITASLLFVNSRLKRIINLFYESFPNSEDIKDYEEIENPEFDEKIDTIITGMEEKFQSKEFYIKVIKLFKDLIFENEIIGAAILSSKGNIIYSSLPNELLIRSLKELEIRFMTGALNLPELFYSLENGQKVFSKYIEFPSKQESLLIVLLFEKSLK